VTDVKIAEIRFPWGEGELVWPRPVGAQQFSWGDKFASSYDDSASYDDDDPWFAFWVADCFDPSIHVIRAPSFETAYEVFCEREADRGFYLIRDGDPDYDDDAGTWTGDGRRVDSEPFQGRELDAPTIKVEV
jgi:hypothetical protein